MMVLLALALVVLAYRALWARRAPDRTKADGVGGWSAVGHAGRQLAWRAATTGVLLVVVTPGIAAAHLERPARFPSGDGTVPVYRTTGPYLVVCKPDSLERIAQLPKELRAANQQLFAECQRHGFQHIQAAIDAVTVAGTRILIQPGIYREQPSLKPLSPGCTGLAGQPVLSYEQQVACRHLQNLIAILGDGPDPDITCDGRLCGLQLEGTGARPEDVVVDGQFQRLNVIRADRADGIYIRNFAIQHSLFNSLYILETDGFAIDQMLGRWNDEYAFLTFASDHGRYTDCEAYGNGDSGLYPGSAAPLGGARPAIEITRCRSHHNFIGLAGTAGNSLLVHDNDFYDNSVGIGLDSVFPGHPGMPQNSSIVTGNRIYANNQDFYRYYRDGTCTKPSAERGYEHGVVCPSAPGPVGTGIVLAGGNTNTFRGNHIWDNWRFGAMQFGVPAQLRGETDPAKQFDTSHFNRYLDNQLGVTPTGEVRANGIDFWWDEEGQGNCWQGNAAGSGVVTSDPASLVDCSAPVVFTPPDPVKFQSLLACLAWRKTNVDPVGCDWTHAPPPPIDRQDPPQAQQAFEQARSMERARPGWSPDAAGR